MKSRRYFGLITKNAKAIYELLRAFVNQFNEMGIMLIAKFSYALPKDMTDRQRLCIAEELELFVKLIIQFKGDSFHAYAGTCSLGQDLKNPDE